MKKYIRFLILAYLRWCAKRRLHKIAPTIIGIGGASGKSSVSTLTAAVLSDYKKVLYQEGKNSDIGIPLAILGLHVGHNDWRNWLSLLARAPFVSPLSYDVYVAEMGIDGPNPPDNMSYLLDLFVPDIALLTNIAFEHSANFPGQTDAEVFESIAKEELSLLHAVAKKGGKVLLNGDDARIMREIDVLCHPRESGNLWIPDHVRDDVEEYSDDDHMFVYSVGDCRGRTSLAMTAPQLSVKKIKITQSLFQMQIAYKRKTYMFTLSFGLPTHYASTILAVLSLVTSLEIPLQDAIQSLQNHFILPPGRANIFQGIKETTIIDSSYNSSLQPLVDMLDFLAILGGKKRKIAILGDMRELGDQTQSLHEQAARKIVETVDLAILIGPSMKKYVLPVLQQENIPVFSSHTFSEARPAILAHIKKGDTILVKGSQNTLFLERAVELLLANPTDAAKLCRRGPMWDKKRAQIA